ncbi:MAG: hypothetical protein ACRD3W_04250, partial [Terriglobales bacterium]
MDVPAKLGYYVDDLPGLFVLAQIGKVGNALRTFGGASLIRRVVAPISLCAIIIGCLAIRASAVDENRKQYLDITMIPDSSAAEAQGLMRPDAEEIAELLKIKPLVDRIRAAKQSGETDYSHMPKPILQAKILCLYKIMIAKQEVRRLVAQLDRELAEGNIALNTLTARKGNFANAVTT